MAAAREIVVLGGGISGLSLAYFLRQALPRAAAARIRVVEASSAAGGWIHTAHRDGFVFEEGPRGFRPSRNGAEMLRLVEQLGLQGEMRAVDAAAKARYVLRNGRVEKLPSSIMEILSWPLSPAVIKAGVHELLTPKTTLDDESVYEFIARRFSPVVAERLLDPVASGIFGGDIRYLSVRSCFQLLWDLEQQHGSVVRGMLLGGSKKEDRLLDGTVKSSFVSQHENSISVSFRNGMSTLVRALEQHIQDDTMSELVLGSRARHLEREPSHWNITIENQATGTEERISASHVFSTLPAFELAPLLSHTLPDAAELLRSIRFVSMGTVHLGYHDAVLKSDGFGYLVPSCEKERVLGVVYDSNAFPSQNVTTPQTRLSVMCGGAHFPAIEHITTSELEALARDAVQRHLHIDAAPDFVRSVVLRNCIPQYHVGFHRTVAALDTQLGRHGLRLGGNSLFGIGLADAVTRSRQLALAFASSLGQQQQH
ncbi:hypothetical protein P43SY_000443 [Pythium insidiosum]|uniref:Protoporphyrinogen oxidase n=1 Tax=Pythium insidiosum TaxID=114742 RepID=A0AAD5Q9L3_PYTIN|nr:hypothetical protein P43SY_000443 [Pythium insidiosum]